MAPQQAQQQRQTTTIEKMMRKPSAIEHPIACREANHGAKTLSRRIGGAPITHADAEGKPRACRLQGQPQKPTSFQAHESYGLFPFDLSPAVDWRIL